MRKLLSKLTGTAVAICFATSFSAQTAGTLTFTYTQVAKAASTCYNFSNTQHTFAIWIQSNAGAFVKTKVRYWGGAASNTGDHLPSWNANSAGNIVSATTGATKSTFGSGVVSWDGTNASSALVADGVYKVTIEECWNHGGTGIAVTSYTFTKGPNVDTQTPANTANFSGIVLNWTPSTIGINEVNSTNPSVNVYPNPTEGVFNVDFKNASTIKVINAIGVVVFEESVSQLSAGTQNIDLTNFANGVYFINVSNGTNSSNHKVLLNK